MALQKFKCYACKTLPESSVFQCIQSHIYCIDCAEEAENVCRCSSELLPRQNPLESALMNLQKCCTFANRGCTWKFSEKQLQNHVKECKYRTISCIAKKFGFCRNCSWEGIWHQFPDHFQKTHSVSDKYSHSVENGTLAAYGTFANLIDAFNKTFVLFYNWSLRTAIVNIIIFVLGRKEVAKTFLYEFEILNQTDTKIRIKFMQQCYSDLDNLIEKISNGQCISLTQNVAKNYVSNSKIHFRLRILKKELNTQTRETSPSNKITPNKYFKGSKK